MLLVLAATTLWPVLWAAWISLYNWNWGTERNFVGLANYVRLLTDPEFWLILRNTVVFATSATAVEMALGLGLALAVDRLGFGASVVRTLLLTPLMMAGIVVALMAKVLLDAFLGVVNWLLSLVGLGPFAFFGAEHSAMATIVAVDAWWQTAFVFIILLAGLQSLPKEPVEAARLDGATTAQILRHVTLPLLRPLLLTVLVIRTIDTLKVFDIVFGTTGGGPRLATEVVQTYAYRTAFSVLQISKAMTIMLVFSLLVTALCLVFLRLGRREA
jgi:multiple sugar transport system permease protein